MGSVRGGFFIWEVFEDSCCVNVKCPRTVDVKM